jgi:hypothetical protein
LQNDKYFQDAEIPQMLLETLEDERDLPEIQYELPPELS